MWIYPYHVFCASNICFYYVHKYDNFFGKYFKIYNFLKIQMGVNSAHKSERKNSTVVPDFPECVDAGSKHSAFNFSPRSTGDEL